MILLDSAFDYTSKAIEFFLSIIKWVFTDFLVKVKVMDVPVIYIFAAMIIFVVVVTGLLNLPRETSARAASVRKTHQRSDDRAGSKKSYKK